MKAGPEKPYRAALAGVAMLGVVVVAVAGTAAGLVTEMTRLSPRIGDIVAFDPARPVAPDLARSVAVMRAGGGACTLDTGRLSARHGSLVIEATRADGRVLAHWAGGKTASGAADCGRDAELVLRPEAVERLAVAAGGFGVGEKQMAFATPFQGAAGVP